MEDARSDYAQDVNITSSFKGPPAETHGTGNKPNGPISGLSDAPPTQDHGPATSSSIGALSDEFEHVLSGHQMSAATHPSLQHVEVDRPEISLQIRNVEHALQSLSEGNTSDIIDHLSKLVPKVIRLERKVKTQTTLRGVFEEQNHQLQTELKQMKDDRDNAREEIRTLQEEVAELKRAKEDEQLGGFDFVTKKEACEIKDAEKKETDRQQNAAAPGGISEELHYNLQRKYLSLKKQIEEIVKVNHSWDTHYREMKAQLESSIDELQKQLKDAKTETLTIKMEQKAGDDKARDDILVQAKMRIEKTEKERAGALADVVVANLKCEKLERYARTLTSQRNEMEREIKRLNEALAQKMRSNAVQPAGVQSTQQEIPCRGPSPPGVLQGQQDQCNPIGSQKRVTDMGEAEMREEIELLRQQTEVFQSDFTHERRDRQRVMGELDAVQKELRRSKKMLQKRDQEGIYEDAQLAQQRQREERRYRQYSASAPVLDYGYHIYRRPPARYTGPAYPQESGRLIAHGKAKGPYNLAGNDLYIDGEDVEIDAPDPRVSVEFNEAYTETTPTHRSQQDTRVCPRCERDFDNDPDYHVHINACLDN